MSDKGLEIDLLGYLIIGIIGIIILLLFVSGPLSSLLRGTYCYFYTKILQQKSDYCAETQTGLQVFTISPNSQSELATYIAGYSISCWRDERPVVKKTIICYSINVNKHPGPVTEYDVTKIMETQQGCNILQNSKIDENGTLVDYPGNCGNADNLDWQVSGNAVTDQQLINIIYDATAGKITVQA